MRICRKCKKELELDKFGKDSRFEDGKQRICLDCRNYSRRMGINKGTRGTYEKHPDMKTDSEEWLRNKTYRSTYGITLGDYNTLFELQEGKCKICSRHQTELKRGLCVDHCHITGIIRGLLCHDCNFGLGNFKDNPDFIDKAHKYLILKEDMRPILQGRPNYIHKEKNRSKNKVKIKQISLN